MNVFQKLWRKLTSSRAKKSTGLPRLMDLHEIMQNMTESIVEFDANGSITFLNTSAEHLLGYEKKRLGDKNRSRSIQGTCWLSIPMG